MAELASIEGVQTYFDVADVTPYQFGARVLVNPVAVGSGVQLKMLDMLMTDAPIVTTSQGVSGLPPACRSQFGIADTPETFAEALVERLGDPGVDLVARRDARRLFDLDAVRAVLASLSAGEDGLSA